jgi:hypothetical protein
MEKLIASSYDNVQGSTWTCIDETITTPSPVKFLLNFLNKIFYSNLHII